MLRYRLTAAYPDADFVSRAVCAHLPFVTWLAVVLLLAYAAVTFGLRSYLQYRKTGSSGFRGISGRPGSLEWLDGVLLLVAFVGLAAVPLLDIVGAVEQIGFLADPIVRMAGLVIFAAGFAATFAAQLVMGASWRIGVQADEVTQLVTDGPFAIVRNPIFAAMLLTAAGLVLMVPNIVAVACWLLAVVAIELRVRVVEEPYLRRIHGDDYHQCAARVGRFVPYLGRLGQWTQRRWFVSGREALGPEDQRGNPAGPHQRPRPSARRDQRNGQPYGRRRGASAHGSPARALARTRPLLPRPRRADVQTVRLRTRAQTLRGPKATTAMTMPVPTRTAASGSRMRAAEVAAPAPITKATSGTAQHAAPAATPSRSGVRARNQLDDFLVLTKPLGAPGEIRDNRVTGRPATGLQDRPERCWSQDLVISHDQFQSPELYAALVHGSGRFERLPFDA